MRRVTYNPAYKLRDELTQVEQKSHPLTYYKKLAVLLREINACRGMPQTRALFRILPYIFTRPSELRLMKWEEIDFKAKIWTKSGKNMKNGLDFIIPLNRQVLAILEEIKQVTGSYEYVFFNTSYKQSLSKGEIRKALERLGYKDEQIPHGFRHVAASTYLNGTGKYQPDWIEAQLAHKLPKTSRASYNKADYLPTG
ncbi:tyrosine-type recombinase/integrase [Neisseria iguanae]|nr:site-specific integrase [Neisseria iguanae]